MTMMPLKGCQKYGNETLNQWGSTGEILVKYGRIDFWTNESTINRQSQTARLKIKKIISIFYFSSIESKLIDYDYRKEFWVYIRTYITNKVLNPLFPRLRRNMKIDSKFPNNPKIPTINIATPSSQNLALSLILS